MHGQPAASLMARESTRRRISGPVPESSPRGPRRAAARALQAAAHRLDPSAAAPRDVVA